MGGRRSGEVSDSPRRLLARQRAELAVQLRIQGLTMVQIAAYPGSDGRPLYTSGKRAWEAIQAQMARNAVLPEGHVPPGAVGRAPATRPWCVYYMRLGNRCKIGMSRDVEARLRAITPEELLGTELGDRHVERRRHLQFADLWVMNEWFRFEGALVEFAAALDPSTRRNGPFRKGPF